MRTAVVSSIEITNAQTLNADYWTSRLDGESPERFSSRRASENMLRRARNHERRARKLRKLAQELTGS